MLRVVLVGEIFLFTAVANWLLIMTILKSAVFVSVDLRVPVGRPLIYHDFMSSIKVILAISRRQVCLSPPLSTLLVDKLVLGYIVISIYVG
jgi:hypothetical protein